VAYTEEEVKAMAAEVREGCDEERCFPFLCPCAPGEGKEKGESSEPTPPVAQPPASPLSRAPPCASRPCTQIDFTDGPNDEGEPFERPGKLSDPLPAPYANEEAARFVNGGAYPPDLSLIVKARHDGANYLFTLLLGYREPPAGVSVREGLHYNPYFPGGAIAMPKMLVDGGTDYDDGTAATEGQQAKDVTTFLAWAAEPEADERKLAGAKWVLVLAAVWATALYYKRWKWAPIKSRRIIVDALF
jgi:ubiquinol-cytochrome c reductase cytochrome c1 subunit